MRRKCEMRERLSPELQREQRQEQERQQMQERQQQQRSMIQEQNRGFHSETTPAWDAASTSRGIAQEQFVEDRNNDSGVSPGHSTSNSSSSSSGRSSSCSGQSNDSNRTRRPRGQRRALLLENVLDNDSPQEANNNSEDVDSFEPVINLYPDGMNAASFAIQEAIHIIPGTRRTVYEERIDPDEEDVEMLPEDMQCPICGFDTLISSVFEEHLATHCSKKAHADGFVKSAIGQLSLLATGALMKGKKRTSRKRVPVNDNEVYDEPGLRIPIVNAQGKVKTYKCKQCDHVGITKLEFWDHSRIHIRSEKLLTCPRCPFVTEYKHHLEYHVRNHYGSKPFKCTECSYTCVNKSMLNSHLKSHSDVYQYRCSDCSYASKYCHSLKLHLRKYEHLPAMVLHADGSPNPLPVIDIYGTRRGPKQKPKKKQSNGIGQQLASQMLPIHQLSSAMFGINGLNGFAGISNANVFNGYGGAPGINAANGFGSPNEYQAVNGFNGGNNLNNVNGFHGTDNFNNANAVNGFNGVNMFQHASGYNAANTYNVGNACNTANGFGGVNSVNGHNDFDGNNDVNGANGVNGVNGFNVVNPTNGLNGVVNNQPVMFHFFGGFPLAQNSATDTPIALGQQLSERFKTAAITEYLRAADSRNAMADDLDEGVNMKCYPMDLSPHSVSNESSMSGEQYSEYMEQPLDLSIHSQISSNVQSTPTMNVPKVTKANRRKGKAVRLDRRVLVDDTDEEQQSQEQQPQVPQPQEQQPQEQQPQEQQPQEQQPQMQQMQEQQPQQFQFPLQSQLLQFSLQPQMLQFPLQPQMLQLTQQQQQQLLQLSQQPQLLQLPQQQQLMQMQQYSQQSQLPPMHQLAQPQLSPVQQYIQQPQLPPMHQLAQPQLSPVQQYIQQPQLPPIQQLAQPQLSPVQQLAQPQQRRKQPRASRQPKEPKKPKERKQPKQPKPRKPRQPKQPKQTKKQTCQTNVLEPQPGCSSESQNGNNELICHYCGIAFGNTLMHTVHMNYHCQDDPFKCKVCGQQCIDKVAFFLHVARCKHT